MRRRAGRPNSASSLHISTPVMSGVNSLPAKGSCADEPRVVVQTLPAVEPSEERLTPAPPLISATGDTPALQKTDVPVRTRLRPHRSSWRDKYACPEVSEIKTGVLETARPTRRSSTGEQLQKPLGPKTSAKVTSPQQAKSLLPEIAPLSPESKKDRWNYPSEDVASIERNLTLMRDRTPSTDSAPESPLAEKELKVKNKRPLSARVAVNRKLQKTVKEEVSPKKIIKPPQPNGKHTRKIAISQKMTPPTSPAPKEPCTPYVVKEGKTIVQSDGPGHCDICDNEFMYLNYHNLTKHKGANISIARPKPTVEVEMIPEPTDVQSEVTVESSTSTEHPLCSDNNVAQEEAMTIAQIVQEDGLIQRFGLKLLRISGDPEQKLLAVSQRMIELVRLLRAAQGFEPTIQCLSQLLHPSYWPIITEAIMYVAGYQRESNSYRNPNFVFDVGQALKFSAHILKEEAALIHQKTYEKDMKDFMGAIDSVINELLPGSAEAKQLHMLATGQEVERALEVAEERQVRDLLATLSEGADQSPVLEPPGINIVQQQPGCVVTSSVDDYIVPDLTGSDGNYTTLETVTLAPSPSSNVPRASSPATIAAVNSIQPSVAGPPFPVGMHISSPAPMVNTTTRVIGSPEKRVGQASLLLELSRGHKVESPQKSTTSGVPQNLKASLSQLLQVTQSLKPIQDQAKNTPIKLQLVKSPQKAKTINLLQGTQKVNKQSIQQTTIGKLVSSPASTKIRIVKIVSQSSQSQTPNRKVGLLIPSQTVSASTLASKTVESTGQGAPKVISFLKPVVTATSTPVRANSDIKQS